EAGGEDRHPYFRVPLGLMMLFDHPKYNWRYFGEPQTHGGNKVRYVPRGKALGGSSSINGMVYARGHAGDYDEWAEFGNVGWEFDQVLPYFKKAENNEDFPDSPFHGQGGPLNVTFMDEYNPLCDLLVESAQLLQYRPNNDTNGENQEGFGIRQVTQRAGRRESTASAYLAPVRSRDNLTVITGATVKRVNIESRAANGVWLERAKRNESIVARGEVLVCAGAIGSPQLLMLSGIGPHEVLAEQGIEPVHVLPGVGQNLQDHFNAALQYRSPTTVPYGLSLRTLPRYAVSALQYALFRKGIFSNNGVQAGGYVKSDPALARPDLQLVLMPALRNAVMQSKTGRVRDRFNELPLGFGFTMTSTVLRQESRGTVSLSSPDPHAPPTIDHNMFSDPEGRDIQTIVRGLKLARRLLQAPPFDSVRGEELRPGARTASDEQLEVYVRKTASTSYHPVGTCKMGPRDDMKAVVDARLCVHGVENLRVIDASIMPRIVGGNTNAPTIMIAEKAADFILKSGT
ncbi:MAG: GMC family oxidoreductase N-terminal domain-containing protein, partial [Pseudomonadota bacterium]